MALEQEVKLPFVTIEAARQTVHAAGGRLVHSRRLLSDTLLDTSDRHLHGAGTALRVRRDGDRAVLTWKGPLHPGPVKSREELETPIGDARTVETMLAALGYSAVFRSQKYREDYDIDGVTVIVDETPFGVFVEIEADPVAIERTAARLGCTPADYRLESYPALWRAWRAAHGLPFADMVFDAAASAPPSDIQRPDR